MISKALLSIPLCMAAALAQSGSHTVERVLAFSSTDTPQAMQEITNALRMVADIDKISRDDSRKMIIVRTTAVQADLAEWIFELLDSPSRVAGAHEYVVPGSSDDVVRVLYASAAPGPRGLQEILNTIRTIAEISRLTAFSPANALVLRGKAWQAGLAEWLAKQLDSPPAGQASATYSVAGMEPFYKARGMEDPGAVRVYHLPSSTAQSLQDTVTSLRNQLPITRVVVCAGPHAIILRATDTQAAAADRLVAESRK